MSKSNLLGEVFEGHGENDPHLNSFVHDLMTDSVLDLFKNSLDRPVVYRVGGVIEEEMSEMEENE